MRIRPVMELIAFYVLLPSLLLFQPSCYTCVQTGKVACYHTHKRLDKTCSDDRIVFYNPITTDVELVDIRSHVDDVVKRHFEREQKQLVCTASNDESVYLDYMYIRNRAPYDPNDHSKLYNVLSTANFYAHPREDYDEWLIIRPAEEWWLEYCKQYTGMQLRNEKYSEINDNLKRHLIQIQKEKETHIDILDVQIAQPRLSPQVESHLANIAEYSSAYRAAEGKQKLDLLEKETETKKKMKETELQNQQEVASAESKKITSAIEYKSKIQKETAAAEIEKIKFDSESARILTIAEANKLAAMKQNEVDADRVQNVFGGDATLLVQEQSAKQFSIAMEHSKSNIIIGNKIPSVFNPYTSLGDTDVDTK